MQLGFVSEQLVNEHIGKIKTALPHLIEAMARMADYPGAREGLMILDMQPSAEALMSVNWVNAVDIPQSEAPVPQMARECRPGHLVKMTIVLAHSDGGRSAYLISPMVSWQVFEHGFCVLSEAHFPPPPQGHSHAPQQERVPNSPGSKMFEGL